MELIHIDQTDPEWGAQLGVRPLWVHEKGTCAGEFCAVHNPSDHPLRDAPLNWRGDRGIMERICPCGIGHDDPDDLAYRASVGREASGIHGCCGHCRTP